MPDSIPSFKEILFFGSDIQISPIYLLSFVLIGAFIYLMRRETGGFLAWFFPRAIWLHRSTRVDFALFTIGQMMTALGLLTRFTATPAVATFVAGLMPSAPFGFIQVAPVGLALLLWIVSDFALYWSHRAHHTITVIWPLHAVHHSAKVMTPITAYRVHPLGILVSTSIQTVIVGTLLGLLVGTLNPDATLFEIAGVNAFVIIVNLTVTNFHHSHIWVSFGPIFERLFISPAQHQVHHSTNPAHFNKNFGQTLAIWDWIFGTLYVTKNDETVSFGLEGQTDASLMKQQLWPILWDPIRRIIKHATERA